MQRDSVFLTKTDHFCFHSCCFFCSAFLSLVVLGSVDYHDIFVPPTTFRHKMAPTNPCLRDVNTWSILVSGFPSWSCGLVNMPSVSPAGNAHYFPPGGQTRHCDGVKKNVKLCFLCHWIIQLSGLQILHRRSHLALFTATGLILVVVVFLKKMLDRAQRNF